MGIQAGVLRSLAFKKESSWGVQPSPLTGAQYLRRVTHNLSLKKNSYQSQEITQRQRLTDFRHGTRRVEGTINGEWSPGTYQVFIENVLRRTSTAVSNLTGLTLTVAVSGAAPKYTITRSAGDFLTGGVKKGMILRVTAGLAAGSLNKNLLVIGVTATILTVVVGNGGTLVPEAGVAACTITVPGKITFDPATGQTDESLYIEDWHPTVPASFAYAGCKVMSMGFNLPPTGMSGVDISIIGKDRVIGATQVFTSPTTETTTGVMAAANGVIAVAGVVVGTLTGINFSVTGNTSGIEVVGSNVTPALFRGRTIVTGQMSALLDSTTFASAFDNETPIEVIAYFPGSSADAADAAAVSLFNVKLSASDPDDGEKGVVQTLPFQAIENNVAANLATENCTMMVHDTAFV